jgi:hypothetical protein
MERRQAHARLLGQYLSRQTRVELVLDTPQGTSNLGDTTIAPQRGSHRITVFASQQAKVDLAQNRRSQNLDLARR